MIEEILVSYLSGALDVPVYMEVPEAPPDSFVVLEKTAGGRVNYISNATMAIQSYGPSMYKAAKLNEQVKAAMDDARELPDISAVDLNSDYNFTDTTEKKYRYQAVFEVVYY